MIDALCRQIGGDAWFPDSLEQDTQTAAREARNTCSVCPVKKTCLQWALEGGERFGIWGGINFGAARAKGLRELRAKHGITLKPRQPDEWLHGTEAGYKRHARAKEIPCPPCSNAMRLARYNRRTKGNAS